VLFILFVGLCRTKKEVYFEFILFQVKMYYSMCPEFVTPQKNVLLATQLNLNDKKLASTT